MTTSTHFEDSDDAVNDSTGERNPLGGFVGGTRRMPVALARAEYRRLRAQGFEAR